MRLPRPYIPLHVRVAVLERMFEKRYGRPIGTGAPWTLRQKLDRDLYVLFGKDKVHLDHDPPLMLRDTIKRNGKIKYLPDANDPDFLIYRNADDHRIKTFVRGDGALRSDMAQRRYLKRVARKPKSKFTPRPAKQISRRPHVPIPTSHGGKIE